MADKTPPVHYELRPVRVSYPHLDAPHAPPASPDNPNPKAQYGLSCVVDEKTLADEIGRQQMTKLINAIKGAATEKFKEKAAGFMTKVLHSIQGPEGEIKSDKGLRSPFIDGVDKNFAKGTLVFNLRSDYRLGLVDRQNRKVIEPAAIREMFYPGCYVRVFVRLNAYNNKGQGVSMYPIAVQFWGDGERLDNRIDPTEVCGPLDAPEPGSIESLIGQAA